MVYSKILDFVQRIFLPFDEIKKFAFEENLIGF
jgi:hypothetical protein